MRKETMSSIYEAIADMSDHHLKVASSYEELEKILDERNTKMNRKWSEQGIGVGWVVQLKFADENEDSYSDTDNYIIANYLNKNYSLVSLTDGEVIATADSVDCLKSLVEEACDSKIELVEAWSNARDWGIDL